MVKLRMPQTNITYRDAGRVASELARIGVEYDRWQASYYVASDASDEEILQAYAAEIERRKQESGYTIADVLTLSAETPGLEEIRKTYRREHWHDDDEVRFVVKGGGIFYVAPEGAGVFAIELEPGDQIRIPRGMCHWFELGPDRSYRAVRLYRHAHSPTPFYTESGRERQFPESD